MQRDLLRFVWRTIGVCMFCGCGAKSRWKNYEGCCFRGKGWMARRDEGEYPSWIFD